MKEHKYVYKKNVFDIALLGSLCRNIHSMLDHFNLTKDYYFITANYDEVNDFIDYCSKERRKLFKGTIRSEKTHFFIFISKNDYSEAGAQKIIFNYDYGFLYKKTFCHEDIDKNAKVFIQHIHETLNNEEWLN